MREEFTILMPDRVIESNLGYSVKVEGRAGILYREGCKSLVVDSEVLAGPVAMVIWANSIRAWDPPHSSDLISEDERARILANIKRAVAADGYTFEVDYSRED